ncbi:alkaline phosphatase D family protein [Pirellulimonas nuda]|uniref:alkaline phosphatase D family protein n=1 Tax=Pirellulimonas nuda TaxID=2528009 RepID=UPI001E4AE0A4|nr:alkaline phosphatase D family protein [Pirellulimonas nuda]
MTATVDQLADGTIPGREGEARLRYAAEADLADAKLTAWKKALPGNNWSLKFQLNGLAPATRQFYRVEMRENAGAPVTRSDVHSFMTAPPSSERAPVHFQVTTCQDVRGASTYSAMAEQQPDFCISAGDTVYYDGSALARTVPTAWQAYEKMFGLPEMKAYHRDVGTYFMKDDHDYRFNDADPYMKGRWVSPMKAGAGAVLTQTRGNKRLDVAWLSHEQGIEVFKQVFPLGDRTDRTVKWGKGIQVWMLEGRDFRSPNSQTDGPDKSIWGAEQTAWLKQTLLASDADHRVVISPTPIIGPDRAMKGDNHANLNGFWYEAQAFLDWVKDNGLDNIIIICGDRHWQYFSVDERNGRNIPEFCCGPTSDDHTQQVPPPYKGVRRPYGARRGGFLGVRFDPADRSLACQFYSMTGEPLFKKVFTP